MCNEFCPTCKKQCMLEPNHLEKEPPQTHNCGEHWWVKIIAGHMPVLIAGALYGQEQEKFPATQPVREKGGKK